MSHDTLESKVEYLCDLIIKADSENWDIKNRSILQMTDFFRAYQEESNAVISDAFTPNVFRALKEPVKALVGFSSSCSVS